MTKNFLEYDEEADTLVIRKPDEDVERSINDRNICVLDLNKNDKIVGLEFLHFRETFPMSAEALKNLKDSSVFNPSSPLGF